MTEREILLANNRDQSKYRIVTGAETLGELQEAIGRNEGVYKMVDGAWISNPRPIDISGLTFTEGITKTQLLTPDSQLPTNVSFKGQVTNNLVMLLTNTNKQIRSGAIDRKEAYRIIKEKGLQQAILDGEGQNFTRVKTDVLERYINVHAEVLEETREELKNLGSEKKEAAAPEKKVKPAPHAGTVEWFYDGLKKMTEENLLNADDIAAIAELTEELAARMHEEKPVVTASDIDKMMSICQ
jgi:hypothetical protein